MATVLAFHAHPDDEVVLTGGTLARLAAEGHRVAPARTRFARADTEQAAARLADLLRGERAEVLLSYEANGDYGHRDHMKVHEVGKRAAELAGTPRVLEVTMPRELLMRGLAITRRLRLPFLYDAVFRPVVGREWFVEEGSAPATWIF